MADPDMETRERVVALEVEVRHLQKSVDEMGAKVTEMHQLLTQARGAKWFMIIVWIGLGGAVTYVLNLLKIIGTVR